MKRRIALILVISLVGVLFGCGKQKYGAIVNESTVQNLPLSGVIIVVDPGHGKANYKLKEPNAPGSDQMKAANAAGTTGKNQTEAQLNLKVAKLVEAQLNELGAQVYMTRTDEVSTLTNAQRAEFSNNLSAHMTVRIHANGSEKESVHGILTMIPGNKYITDAKVIEDSKRAGELVQKQLIYKTGAKDMGLEVHNDLTGFNWTKVPTILVEMGFMTNRDEDLLLEKSEYQQKIADAIVLGLREYFS